MLGSARRSPPNPPVVERLAPMPRCASAAHPLHSPLNISRATSVPLLPVPAYTATGGAANRRAREWIPRALAAHGASSPPQPDDLNPCPRRPHRFGGSGCGRAGLEIGLVLTGKPVPPNSGAARRREAARHTRALCAPMPRYHAFAAVIDGSPRVVAATFKPRRSLRGSVLTLARSPYRNPPGSKRDRRREAEVETLPGRADGGAESAETGRQPVRKRKRDRLAVESQLISDIAPAVIPADVHLTNSPPPRPDRGSRRASLRDNGSRLLFVEAQGALEAICCHCWRPPRSQLAISKSQVARTDSARQKTCRRPRHPSPGGCSKPRPQRCSLSAQSSNARTPLAERRRAIDEHPPSRRRR